MPLGKQSKILTNKQAEVIVSYLSGRRNGLRNKVIFLLSVKAGLRAKEIASLKWSMVVDPDGNISSIIQLPNEASKGSSGRIIPINKKLKQSLIEMLNEEMKKKDFDIANSFVVQTERSKCTSAQAIVNMFQRWYRSLGYVGYSSHSGRRTFITNASRKIGAVGGSIRDIQIMAGHRNLQTTQRYVDYDTDCQKKVVDLI